MNQMVFNPGDTTFWRGQMDIGDYLEVEFERELGVIGGYRSKSGTFKHIYGFDLKILLSADRMPHQVRFTTVLESEVSLLQGREPGEKLTLKVHYHRVMNGAMRIPMLCVNNEIELPSGRVKV